MCRRKQEHVPEIRNLSADILKFRLLNLNWNQNIFELKILKRCLLSLTLTQFLAEIYFLLQIIVL